MRRKALRSVSAGIAHINATFNNTQVTITDLKGAVLGWSSSGRMGFKGTRKSTAYAATVVAQDAARQMSAYRMQELEVRVQGPGSGRESAIRALQAAGLAITLIRDVTPMPHDGCRPRKRRRV
ncbi:MAG: 30S ribosomal protein S11 [Kiritimatiellae bacterium]|nr:30S ribosomal protein S11 [Kiritimatiellia bacterium]